MMTGHDFNRDAGPVSLGLGQSGDEIAGYGQKPYPKGILFKCHPLHLHLVCHPEIVRVEKGKIISFCHCYALITGSAGSRVFLVMIPY